MATRAESSKNLDAFRNQQLLYIEEIPTKKNIDQHDFSNF